MRLAWRLALRDLRGGIGSLRLLAICLFLGVAAIAGIGSLTAAMTAELAAQGRTFLGGDLRISLSQRQATPEERAIIMQLGRVSESAKLNAMISRADGSGATLAALKAVDARYPLVGTLATTTTARARLPESGEVLLDPALADRLGVRTGDVVRIGGARVRVGGLIATEPDALGEGFRFAPAALIGMDTLAATGLVQPGSLYDWRYRILLPAGSDASARREALEKAHAGAGWRVQDSSDGAPSLRRSIDRIGQFLTLVGLASLLIAGIGVGNGVAAYLTAKRTGIATLKTLGASSDLIGRIYMLEIGLIACGAVMIGLATGVLVPPIVSAIAGDALPVPVRLGIYPLPLATAALYGLLVAVAFAAPPLAAARRVGAASLFRGAVEARGGIDWRVALLSAAAIAAAAALAVFSARDPLFAAGVLGVAAALVLVLAAIGRGVRRVAAPLPPPHHPLPRLAIANLHAPAAQTDRLVIALGLGLTLFATLAIIQTSLAAQLRSTVPARAPSFFVLDIPNDGLPAFTSLVGRIAPVANLVTVPSLRGPVVALNGARVADMKRPPEGAWILRGDRGLTFARDLPAGNRITAGRWWAADYAGPPLVSMDAEAGETLGLKVGDEITVSALGVEVSARIASFREIDWSTMGFNFVLVFSPGTFDGAPYNHMATLTVPPAREAALNQAVASAFPSASLIRVRDVIATVGALFGQLATAVAAASSVAIAAGIAVLVGAIVAARQARIYDAVLLKLLGATRGQVLLVQAIEYALLAGLVAVIALGAAAAAGWYVVTDVFDLPFAPDWGIVLATLGAGMAIILAIGLVGTLPALAARPARALRAL